MTYDELCTLVGTIDKDAEQYMRTEAKELSGFSADDNGDTITNVFPWDETEQGAAYWSEIWKKLGGKYE